MIKKIIIVLIMLNTIPTAAQAVPQENGFSGKFVKKFKNCDVYAEPYTFNMYGTVFHDFKQIQGMNGNYCGYKQITGTANGRLTVTCNFSRENMKTLYAALLLKPERYGKENPTEKIWQKIMHDPNICRFEHSGISTDGIRVDEKYLPNF